jgi:pimeloyl-ACP methyl ester carboxylesterase
MDTTPTRAVEDCLIELFQALGIAQAHIAAGQLVPGGLNLATGYPERVASLILVSPRPRSELNGLESRLLVVAGDKGLSAQGPAKLLADLPSAADAAETSTDWGDPRARSPFRHDPTLV